MAELRPDQRAFFHEHGYLMIEDAVDDTLLARLQRDFATWVEESRAHEAAWGDTVDGRPRFDLEPGHSSAPPGLRRVNAPVEVSAAYLAATVESRMADCVAELIGPDVKLPRAQARRLADAVRGRAGTGRRARLPHAMGQDRRVELSRDRGRDPHQPPGLRLRDLEPARDDGGGLAYGARSRRLVEAGGKPLHRAVSLIHGTLAEDAAANSARALKEGRAVPIELLCRAVPA